MACNHRRCAAVARPGSASIDVSLSSRLPLLPLLPPCRHLPPRTHPLTLPLHHLSPHRAAMPSSRIGGSMTSRMLLPLCCELGARRAYHGSSSNNPKSPSLPSLSVRALCRRVRNAPPTPACATYFRAVPPLRRRTLTFNRERERRCARASVE